MKVLEPHEEIIREISLKYAISQETVKSVVSFVFKKTIEEMESKEFNEVMLPYFGKFCVSIPRKLTYDCHQQYLKDGGEPDKSKRDPRDYQRYKEEYYKNKGYKKIG